VIAAVKREGAAIDETPVTHRDGVVRHELPTKLAFAPMAPAPLTWKTKTAFGLPPPSSDTVPVFDTAPAMLYSPDGMGGAV
jgi:hypothetical protein